MSDNNGVTKGAILMLALGEAGASEVMKFLGPREVQKLGEAMTSMKSIPQEQVETVLEDFNNVADRNSMLGLDSNDYIRNVLKNALGEDKASSLLNRILGGGGDASGIESLKWMDSESVADLIHSEHPQTIATILVHLERDQACEILNEFTERLRNDVLTKLLSGSDVLKKQPMGGTRAAADILNFMGGDNESSAMEYLKSYDPDMAQKIMDEMFVFENIMDIEDRGIQLLLREVQSDSLIIALKGASEGMREKIFKNMSQRAAEMMREDLESKGPVRLSEVEAQQKEILVIVRRLADEGQISLGAKGEEQYV